ncbi:MAG: O-antigen ligase family protein [Myxococcota bacterium]
MAGFYTTRPASVMALLPVGAVTALAWTGGDRAGIFGLAAALSAILAAWQPRLLVWWLLPLAASDLILTLDVGGFTFRAAQCAGVALTASAVARTGVRGFIRFALQLPGMPLLVALIATLALRLVMGVPNPGKGAGYVAWALFDIVVLAPSLAWHVRRTRAHAVVWWCWGGALIAVFGLLQVLLAAIEVDPPLVTQWFGARARINAFSYEPSYFAFQAMIPTAILVGLVVAGRTKGWGGWATLATVLLLSALGLSTSRSAWAGSAALLAVFSVAMVARWRWRALPGRDAFRVLAVFAAVVIVVAALTPPAAFASDRMLAARALDTSDPASGEPRMIGLVHAWRLFQKHPILGVGPGQFGGALLADQSVWARKIMPHEQDPDALVTYNIYLELLSETGLVGTLLVGAAVLLVLWGLWRASRRKGISGRWTEVLLWPLIMTFAVMYQVNQTLWRTEVWCLVGVAWAFLTPRAPRR